MWIRAGGGKNPKGDHRSKKSRIWVTLGPLVCDSGVPILYHESYSLPWVLSKPCVLVYTISPCHYHESLSIPLVLVNTMSPCQHYKSLSITRVQVSTVTPSLYRESLSIQWVLVNTKNPCQYHEYMSIPWVAVHTMTPCQYHEFLFLNTMSSYLYNESLSIPRVLGHTKRSSIYLIQSIYHESLSILVEEKKNIHLGQIIYPVKTNTIYSEDKYNIQ